MTEQELQEIERSIDELGDDFVLEVCRFMPEGPATPLRGSQVRALIAEVRRLRKALSLSQPLPGAQDALNTQILMNGGVVVPR